MSKVAALLQQAASTMASEQKREAERATRRRYELGDYLVRKMATDPALRERVAVDMNAECTRVSTRALFDLDTDETWFDKLEDAGSGPALASERSVRSRKRAETPPARTAAPADVPSQPSSSSKVAQPGSAAAPAPATRPAPVSPTAGAKPPAAQPEAARAS